MDISDKYDAIEEMEDPTVLDRAELDYDSVDELRDRAADAEELEADVDDLQADVDELEATVDDYESQLDGVADARLTELREAEDPVVLEADRLAELTDLESELSALFAEELAQYSPFEAEELSERFGPMELYESVDDEDDLDLFDELGDAEEHVKSGNERDDDVEELEADDEDEPEQEAIEERVEELRRLGFDEQADKIEAGELDVDLA